MAKDDKNVLLIVQDIKLAKILAGNDKKIRETTLKKLGKWLKARVQKDLVDEDVFMRIWKGLFYAMWMSDKPLVQEECAENISKLVHFSNAEKSLLFFKCFLKTMIHEWPGIDQYRIDKFLMLVRRVLRQTFLVLKNENWSDNLIYTFREILNKTILEIGMATSSSLSLMLHFDEIYLVELAKVSRGKLKQEVLLELVQPFVQQVARCTDLRQCRHVGQHIFRYLIDQSDVGIEYKEKFYIWRRQGFPGGSIDALEKVEITKDDDADDDNVDDDIDDDDEQYLKTVPQDPRAGKVDVILPQLQFDPLAIISLLEEVQYKHYTTFAGRKQIIKLVEQFKKVSNGTYPFGPNTIVNTKEKNGYSTKLKTSVKRLQKFEQNLRNNNTKKRKRNRNKKIKEILMKQLNNQKQSEQQKTNEKSRKKTNEKPQQTFEDFVKLSEGHLMAHLSKKRKKINSPKVGNSVKNKIKKSKINNSTNLLSTKNSTNFIENAGTWTVEEFDVSTNNATPSRITNDDWSKPLENGETEYFVVSKKAKKKQLLNPFSISPTKTFSPIPKNTNNDTNPTTTSTPKTLTIFNNKTPKSIKKIKFSDLNQSQDYTEHIQQVRNSPVIPYDATKQPTKPLLKPSTVLKTSPINPFYKKRFSN